MAYGLPERNRANQTEVLVFERKVSCSTAASGVVNHTIDLPPGAFNIGISLSSQAADQALIGKVYLFQDKTQDTGADALSTVLSVLPHAAAAAATLLTAPATTTYGGTSGQLVQGTTHVMQENFILPYGLMLQTTCDTNSGHYTYKVICQQRT